MRSFVRYFWRWLTVAFGHSWSIYESFSGFAGVILFVIGRFRPVTESVGVMVTEIAITVLLLLFTLRMVLAPYWMANEDAHKIERQKKEIDELREKLSPKLVILGVVYETEPAQAKVLINIPCTREVKIQVKNTGAAILKDCCAVYLENFSSAGGHIHKPDKAALITQTQKRDNRAGGPFTLRAGESEYIEVARLDESNLAKEIDLQFGSPNIPRSIPRSDTFYFDIVAYSEGAPDSKRFNLYVDNDGGLTMEQCPTIGTRQ